MLGQYHLRARFRWSVTGKVGLVIGADPWDDYLGPFVSYTVPTRNLPRKLREQIGRAANKLGPLWARAEAGIAALLAIPNTHPGFVQLVRGWMRWFRDAGQASGELGNLIHQGLNSLDEYVNIFFDPEDGDPWGIAYLGGLSNTGARSVTGSWYYDLGPL